MNRPTITITPSQQATNGAMDIFVEGHLSKNIPRMLFGLEVLRSASESQIQTAIRYQQSVRHQLSLPQIEAMFAT